MDLRTALPNGSQLQFPSMTVTLECEVGRGSNAIVYRGTYPDLQSHTLHHILIKELFPLHPEARIYRTEDGSLCYAEAEDFFRFHKLSFEKGNTVHLKILSHSPDGAGGNVNTFSYNRTLYTVLQYNGGRSLADELDAHTFTLAQVVKAMKGILYALRDFHQNGFLHLDIAPDNIMLLGTNERERIMLIDYNSAMEQSVWQTHFSIKQGYSAPEVQRGDVAAFTPATDLYSVAAVFFRCIRGYALQPFEVHRKTPPAVSHCKILQGLPETCISMVKEILYRGLSAIGARRYATVDEMLVAFEELDDRIQGVGITHWALWEAGKRTVQSLIQSNTALRYLRDGESLFPMFTQSETDGRKSMDASIRALTDGESHLFVSAPGGMGKTTSMLYALLQSSKRYSPQSPAIVYLSLHGACADSHTVTDKILENLHFKANVQNYREARHALHQLLTKPLVHDGGTRPCVVLFLDGLNEVSEGVSYLLDEIASLARLDGIRLYITSRTDCALEGFRHLQLSPLTLGEVQTVLTRHHLLMPDSPTMQELLRTPIMLSMFLGLSEQNGTQPQAKSGEELVEAYLDSLVQKELATLPEDSSLRLKIEVAVQLVLPRIAARLQKSGLPCDDAALFKESAAAYRLIRSPLLIKAFPQWIGHKRTILDGIESADDWYDILVRKLLWQRLGLLIKNEQGQYVLAHQIITDHLAAGHTAIKKRIVRYQAIKHSLIAVICLVLAGAIALACVKSAPDPAIPYQESYAITVLTDALNAYQVSSLQYSAIRKLTDALAETPEAYAASLAEYEHSSKFISANLPSGAYQSRVELLLASGEVFEWTQQELQTEEYLQLFTLIEEREVQYADIVGAFSYMMHDDTVFSKYGEAYTKTVSDLIELDAEITATLYAIACRAHLYAAMDAFSQSGDEVKAMHVNSWTAVLSATHPINDRVPTEESPIALRDRLQNLMGKRKDQYLNLQSQGAYILYQNQKETPS
ncbi:MAG: hypothetical protein IJW46_04155 [Clostridia bacterium]|nr:hypothetical protein [Clostridia bacterium]